MAKSGMLLRILAILIFVHLDHLALSADTNQVLGSEEEVLQELYGNLDADSPAKVSGVSHSEKEDEHEETADTKPSQGHFCGTVQKKVGEKPHVIRYTRLLRETFKGYCRDAETQTQYSCVQWRVKPQVMQKSIMKPVVKDTPVCCPGWSGDECLTPVVKGGFCPEVSDLSAESCEEECQHDGDCSGSQKCCKAPCGSTCVNPATAHLRAELRQAIQQTAPVAQIALSQMAKSPYHALCSVWGFDHLRAFNRRWVNFTGGCQYTLVKHESVEISYEYTDQCLQLRTAAGCPKRLFLRLKMSTGQIDVSVYKSKNKPGPTIHVKGEDRHIPAKIGHAFFEHVGGYVIIFGNEWKILFDYLKGSIQILFTDEQLDGLCGNMREKPGYIANDKVADYEQPWKRPSSVDSVFCSRIEVVSYKGMDPCLDPRLTAAQRLVAHTRCSPLNGTNFAVCHAVDQALLPFNKFYEACERDLCAGILDGVDVAHCPCGTATEYARQCKMFSAQAAANLSWQEPDYCLTKCGLNQEYQECGTTCPRSCSAVNANPSDCLDYCIDGCTCKSNLYVNNTLCYQKSECSCSYMGTWYTPGAVVKQRCSSCTCTGGEWQCTTKDCGGTCSITGKTRIITFDSKPYIYNFAPCIYTVLRKTNLFRVEISLRACQPGQASYCIYKVEVVWGTFVVVLEKTTQAIGENGTMHSTLPYPTPPATSIGSVVNASSHFRRVEIMDQHTPDLVVEWNGAERLYLLLDSAYKTRSGSTSQLTGLCGNYDSDTDNDVPGVPTDFGDSQGTLPASQSPTNNCTSVPPRSTCPTSVDIAKKTCKRVLQNAQIFGKCWNVVPINSAGTNHVQVCEDDVCNCPDDYLDPSVAGQSCLCQSLATYAHLCSLSGVRLDWRVHFPACRVPCPPNQHYKECGRSCPATCPQLLMSQDALCNHTECLEGCECEPGFVRDQTPYGACVPLDKCSCVDDRMPFSPGSVIVRNNTGITSQCECKNGDWECRPYTPHNMTCTGGKVHKTCAPACEATCDNQNPTHCQENVCIDRCTCPTGQYQVSDTNTTCVDRSMCPCKHGSKLFPAGFEYPLDCNNCTCADGSWQCTSKECYGFCAATGDPHYESFDGFRYSFQGQTQYVLAKYANDFEILVQNIDCGEDGVTCTKAVEIRYPNESIVITLDQELVTKVNYQVVVPPYDVCTARIMYNNLFVVVLDATRKFKVSWDGSMRVYVEAHECYGGKMEGLCGNFDGDASNDLQARSGIQEASVYAFGNSWKVNPIALDTPNQYDSTCDLKGGLRRLESEAICKEALMSDVFASCRNLIDVNYYLQRCIESTCACDKPGDDRCKCTSIAHYAHMCGRKGICVLWRDQFGCPMQCTGEGEYDACTCPNPCPGTTDKCTRLQYHEGCRCPPGKVYDGWTCQPCPNCTDSIGNIVPVGTTETRGQATYECLSGRGDMTLKCPERYPPCCEETSCLGISCGECQVVTGSCCGNDQKCVPKICNNINDCSTRIAPTGQSCTPQSITRKDNCNCTTTTCPCPGAITTCACEFEVVEKTWNPVTCCYDYRCVCSDSKCHEHRANHTTSVSNSLNPGESLAKVVCRPGQCYSNTSHSNSSCSGCCDSTVHVHKCTCDPTCNDTCSQPTCTRCQKLVVKTPATMINDDCCHVFECVDITPPGCSRTCSCSDKIPVDAPGLDDRCCSNYTCECSKNCTEVIRGHIGQYSLQANEYYVKPSQSAGVCVRNRTVQTDCNCCSYVIYTAECCLDRCPLPDSCNSTCPGYDLQTIDATNVLPHCCPTYKCIARTPPNCQKSCCNESDVKDKKTLNLTSCCNEVVCECNSTKCNETITAFKNAPGNSGIVFDRSQLQCKKSECEKEKEHVFCKDCCSVKVYFCESITTPRLCSPKTCCEYESEEVTWNATNCCNETSCKCDKTKCPTFLQTHKSHVESGLSGSQNTTRYNCKPGQCYSNTSHSNSACDDCCSSTVTVHECRCDTACNDTCSKPTCSRCQTLNITRLATMKGDDCCPTYSCVDITPPSCSRTCSCSDKIPVDAPGLDDRCCSNYTCECSGNCNSGSQLPDPKVGVCVSSRATFSECGCCKSTAYTEYCCTETCPNITCNATCPRETLVKTNASGIVGDCCDKYRCDQLLPLPCDKTCCSTEYLSVTGMRNSSACCEEQSCVCNRTKCDEKIEEFKNNNPLIRDRIDNSSFTCPQGYCRQVAKTHVICDQCCSFKEYNCTHVDYSCGPPTTSCPCQAMQANLVYNNKSCCPETKCDCVSTDSCTALKNVFKSQNPHLHYYANITCGKGGIVMKSQNPVTSNMCGQECCSVDSFSCACNASYCNTSQYTKNQTQCTSNGGVWRQTSTATGVYPNCCNQWTCMCNASYCPSSIDYTGNRTACKAAGGVWRIKHNSTGQYPDCCDHWKCGCECSMCDKCDNCSWIRPGDYGVCSSTDYVNNHQYQSCCSSCTRRTCANPVCTVNEVAIPDPADPCCTICKCKDSVCNSCPQAQSEKCRAPKVDTLGKCDNSTTATACCTTYTNECDVASCENARQQYRDSHSSSIFSPNRDCPEGLCPESFSIDLCTSCPACNIVVYNCTNHTRRVHNCAEKPISCEACPVTTVNMTFNSSQCCPLYNCDCSDALTCENVKNAFKLNNAQHNYTSNINCGEGAVRNLSTIAVTSDGCGKDCCSVDTYGCKCDQTGCRDYAAEITKCVSKGGAWTKNHTPTHVYPDCCPTYQCTCRCSDCPASYDCPVCEDRSPDKIGVCSPSAGLMVLSGNQTCCTGSCDPICKVPPPSCGPDEILVNGTRATGCCPTCQCKPDVCLNCPSKPLENKCQEVYNVTGRCKGNTTASQCCNVYTVKDLVSCRPPACPTGPTKIVPANVTAERCCDTCECNCSSCPTLTSCTKECYTQSITHGQCSDTSLTSGACCATSTCSCNVSSCQAAKVKYLQSNGLIASAAFLTCPLGQCLRNFSDTSSSCADCCVLEGYKCVNYDESFCPKKNHTCDCDVKNGIDDFKLGKCCPGKKCECITESTCAQRRADYINRKGSDRDFYDPATACGQYEIAVPGMVEAVGNGSCGIECCNVTRYTCNCNCSACPSSSCDQQCHVRTELSSGKCTIGTGSKCCATYSDCKPNCTTTTLNNCSDSIKSYDACGCPFPECQSPPVLPDPCCCGEREVRTNGTGVPCNCHNTYHPTCVYTAKCKVLVNASDTPIELAQKYCPDGFSYESTDTLSSVQSGSCPGTTCERCGECKCEPCPSIAGSDRDMCGPGCVGCVTRYMKTSDFHRTFAITNPKANPAPFNCCRPILECTAECNRSIPKCPECEEPEVSIIATGDPYTCGCCPTYKCVPKICPTLPELPPNDNVCNGTYDGRNVTFDMFVTENTTCCQKHVLRRNVTVPCVLDIKCMNISVPDPSNCTADQCIPIYSHTSICNGTLRRNTTVTVINHSCCNCTDQEIKVVDSNQCCKCQTCPPGNCSGKYLPSQDKTSCVWYDCQTLLHYNGASTSDLTHYTKYGLGPSCDRGTRCPMYKDRDSRCDLTLSTDPVTCCKNYTQCCNGTKVNCTECQDKVTLPDGQGCYYEKCVDRTCKSRPSCHGRCSVNDGPIDGCGCYSGAKCVCPMCPSSIPPSEIPCCFKNQTHVLVPAVDDPENCNCSCAYYKCEDCPQPVVDKFKKAQQCPTQANVSLDCSTNVATNCEVPGCKKPCPSPKACGACYIERVVSPGTGELCDCCPNTVCDCDPSLANTCSGPQPNCSCNETVYCEQVHGACCPQYKCVDKCDPRVVTCATLSCPVSDRIFEKEGDCCQVCRSTCPAQCYGTLPSWCPSSPPSTGGPST